MCVANTVVIMGEGVGGVRGGIFNQANQIGFTSGMQTGTSKPGMILLCKYQLIITGGEAVRRIQPAALTPMIKTGNEICHLSFVFGQQKRSFT